MTYKALTTIALLTGCDEGGSCKEPSRFVSLNVLGQPTLVTYVDRDGNWILPESGDSGDYGMCVGETTHVVVVCEEIDGRFQVMQRTSTFEEENEIGWVCANVFAANPTVETVRLQGRMLQPGRVLVAGAGLASSSPDWPFVFQRIPGQYDLIASDAYDGSGRVSIRRGLDVTDTLDIGVIDLDNDGTATEPVDITVQNGILSEGYFVAATLRTSRLEAEISASNGLVAHILPESSIADGDSQGLRIEGDTLVDSGRRILRTALLNDVVTGVELLPPAEVSFDEPTMSASWTAGSPTYSSATLELAGGGNSLHVSVTRGAAEVGDVGNVLQLDTSSPDYLSRWRIDGPALFSRSLTLLEVVEDGTLGVSLFETP